MKKYLFAFLLIPFTFQFATLNASVHLSVEVINPKIEKKELVYSKSLKVKDVENFLGRKMTFFEKVSFKNEKVSNPRASP